MTKQTRTKRRWGRRRRRFRMQTQYVKIENRKEHDENMMENVQVK